jgi:hypothetical protein
MRAWSTAGQESPFFLSEDGSVSVEFALWIPVIFFFFLLVADASAAFMAQAQMWHVAGDVSRGLATGRITPTEAFQNIQGLRWSCFFDQIAAQLRWIRVSSQAAILMGSVWLAWTSSGVKMPWVEWGRSAL